MSFRKLGRLLLIAGAVLALASCKDDEKTETKPSLSGILDFDVAAFVFPEQVVTMTPEGLSHPDGKGIGYFWKVTPDMSYNDTTRLENGLTIDGKPSDGSFTYRFRDSLGTYTITCYGFAAGYSPSDSRSYATVVQPGLDGSITGTGIRKTDPKVTESEIDYYYMRHNGLDWMRSNLANPSSGVAFRSFDATSNVFGRYYSFEDALTACPEGWRLPTDKEWREMAASVSGKEVADPFETIMGVAADLMGDIQFNSMEMWEYWPAVGEITNKSRLAIMPAGYVNLGAQVDGKYPTASFKGMNEYAAFWTSDIANDGMAYYRYLFCDQPDMFAGKGDTKTFGASVRCVRESK